MCIFEGDINIVGELVCVQSFNYENADIFLPLYEKRPLYGVTRAVVTHAKCGLETTFEVIEADDFKSLVKKWVSNLHHSCTEEVEKLLQSSYEYLNLL
jgi:hypothetical protein